MMISPVLEKRNDLHPHQPITPVFSVYGSQKLV
jgi:hypothetical protein